MRTCLGLGRPKKKSEEKFEICMWSNLSTHVIGAARVRTVTSNGQTKATAATFTTLITIMKTNWEKRWKVISRSSWHRSLLPTRMIIRFQFITLADDVVKIWGREKELCRQIFLINNVEFFIILLKISFLPQIHWQIHPIFSITFLSSLLCLPFFSKICSCPVFQQL